MVAKTLIANLALSFTLVASPSKVGNTANSNLVKTEYIHTMELPTITIKARKIRKAMTFENFKLESPCDTNVTTNLRTALRSYTGPEIKITSLKRHYNCKSKHFHGKAVDLQFSHELIDWLVSDEGQQWLNQHNMLFYIEDRPHSRKLLRYKKEAIYSKYVFENPHSTGAHIHINIK